MASFQKAAASERFSVGMTYRCFLGMASETCEHFEIFLKLPVKPTYILNLQKMLLLVYEIF